MTKEHKTLSRKRICLSLIVVVLALACSGVFVWVHKHNSASGSSVGRIANAAKADPSSSASADADPSAAAAGQQPSDEQSSEGQPPIDMDKATKKLDGCVRESTPDKLADAKAAQDILRRCFYSSGAHQGDIYAIRSIGDVHAVATVYDDKYGDAAQGAARTVTEFQLPDGTSVAGVTCFWDVQLMQCKVQDVVFTPDGMDLFSRSVRSQGQALEQAGI